jgi:hypothetical protein
VQQPQTDAQANQTGAAQDLTLYQEESAAQQIEGKPRCITIMLKVPAPMLLYLCIKFRCCFGTLDA